jgi:hypothetical protein
MSTTLRYYDATKYATSTMLAKFSRLKHVEAIRAKNNGILSALTIKEYLNDLPVSNRYKQSIVALIGREQQVDVSAIKFKTIKRVPSAPSDIVALKKLLLESLKFLADLKDKRLNEAQIFTRGKIESVVAIAIAYCTGLRTNELLSLKIAELHMLLLNQVIPIRIKKKLVSKQIATLSVYRDMYPYLIYALAESYDTIDSPKITPRFQVVTKEQFLASPHTSEIASQRAFTTCTTTINAEIRLAYLHYNNTPPKTPVGLKSIRKLNTTEIIELGHPEVASFFNRHNKLATAQDYYTLPNTDQAFEKLSATSAREE